MHDNRIFNINGEGEDMLLRALELVFIQEGFDDRPATVKAYLVTPDQGMILYWHQDHRVCVPLPTPMTAKQILPMIMAWLKNPCVEVKCEGWDANADHDGRNELGWRVYCEDWGKVNHEDAICAVKPAYLWLGK